MVNNEVMPDNANVSNDAVASYNAMMGTLAMMQECHKAYSNNDAIKPMLAMIPTPVMRQ